MAYGSHTLGRGFSVNTLDGIEVKIGENFKPIEKVALPMRYRQADPTDVLEAAQYDFGTEMAFLRWLQAKKKNDADKEAAKQAALKAQKEQQSEAVAAAPRREQQTAVSSQPASTTTNSAVSPVVSGLGPDILMPTPLHSGATTTTQAVPPTIKSQTSFDPRDFENNAFDPFEMTELQTLNDMDELRVVLGNSIPPPQVQQGSSASQVQQGSSASQVQQGSSEQTNQESAQNHLSNAQPTPTASSNSVTVNDASPSEPEYQNIQKQHDYQNVQRQQQPNAKQDSNQHEYQNVQIEAGTGLVMFKPDKPDIPPLPPRNVDQTAPNGALNPGLMPNGLGDMPEGASKSGTMNINFPTRTPLPPISPSSSGATTNVSITSSSSSSGGSGTQTTEAPELPERSGPSPRSRSPPPSYYAPDYSSTPGLPMPGAVPLPGMPTEPPPSYPQSVSNYSIPPTSSLRQRTLSEEERSRPDPVYDAMSTEDKNFVMTMMGMGFPKSRTARAVKRIGKDDRLVVESLCAVDNLCSEGFPEDRAEEAINLHDNDQEKAKDFLKLWKQFEELGFKGEDIKRELIVHNNNQEKVLDSLTA